MYDNYACMRQQIGYDFENAMVEALETVATVVYANQKQDTVEGTDAFVNRVRTDFTLNFNGKTKTERVGSWGDFLIGVRKGNARRNFKEPVLVIGLDMKPAMAKLITNRIKTEIGDVSAFINKAQDLYWDWLDRHPEYNM